jgi:hypothetical protein
MLERIREALVPGGYFVCQFYWDPGRAPSRRGQLARRLIAYLTLGNLGYEPGDFLLYNMEFIHAFGSEQVVRSEFEAGGCDIMEMHISPRRRRGGVLLRSRQGAHH